MAIFEKSVTARPSGTNVKDPDSPRIVRIRRKAEGEDIYLSVLGPHRTLALSTVRLTSAEARELAHLLTQVSAVEIEAAA